jgi:hypothetical protein
MCSITICIKIILLQIHVNYRASFVQAVIYHLYTVRCSSLHAGAQFSCSILS